MTPDRERPDHCRDLLEAGIDRALAETARDPRALADAEARLQAAAEAIADEIMQEAAQ